MITEAEASVTRRIDPGSPHEAWAIVNGDKLVGHVGITVDDANRSGWFWYWMADAARGSGWSARAAPTVAEWALTVRGLEPLELGHRVNNPASGTIAGRAGFIEEGTERATDVVRAVRSR